MSRAKLNAISDMLGEQAHQRRFVPSRWGLSEARRLDMSPVALGVSLVSGGLMPAKAASTNAAT